ncbi:MAG: DUF427 domain-containing protein [Ancalomicrobiaceae bacterium]|nr:DUF427 domain-containing protein [Ancalomicrobiaceae bacterium]
MSDGHTITIDKAAGTISVKWQGHTIARTTSALELREASYPPVFYIPRADADMAYLERTTRETTCPYKGIANYFTLTADGISDANAVWTYEQPKQGVGEIAGHLAFYPDKVEIVRA